MVATVGTATTARISAGTIVHPISRGVLPWICFGLSGLPSRWRNLMAAKTVAPSTRIPMTIAIVRIGRKRSSILLAEVPWGFSEFWPLLLVLPQAASRSAMPATRTGAAMRLLGCLMPCSPHAPVRGSAPPNPSPATRRRLYPRPIRRQQLVAALDRRRVVGVGGPSQAQSVEGMGAALPLLVDPHGGFQVHAGAEEPLELQAGLGARVADHAAALADHDPLLRVALDPHDRPVPEDLLTFVVGVRRHGVVV